MVGPTPDELAHASSLEDLYAKLAPLGMGAGWNKPTPALWSAPRKHFRPVHWSYAQAKGALNAAGRLINTQLAERRNLILANPVEANTYSTTRTMVAAYQMIMPGEKARSHRHVPNALRLIVDADPGAYTTVDDKKLPMLPGDVVLTPNWCWHGHGNEGKSPAYWIDFLDVPLVQFLEPMFFEQHPDEFEAGASPAPNSPMLFTWRDTQRKLNQPAADPGGPYGTQIELGSSPALTTLALFMMRLMPGRNTPPHKTTANNIYAVVQGNGTTFVEGEPFEWQRGDVIVVPTWYEHYHQSGEGAVLFRVSDAPVMANFGFLREAPKN